MSGKVDLAIVNRGFWPQSQVLGEALLCFAEQAAETQSVCVIMQSQECVREIMQDAGRGKNVQVRACKAYTDSSSGLAKRSFEAVYFMFWVIVSLTSARPAKVYVATDPPVLVPFIVFLYCKLFRAKYFYHLQDIHPEAANIVVPLNRFIFCALRWVDNVTMRNAHALITLSQDMRQFIIQRSGTDVPMHLLDNPSFSVEVGEGSERPGDIVFCGNVGRLQRIPLLIKAITAYLQRGGKLKFTFIGAGLYAPQIMALADAYEDVTYLGYLPASRAADVIKTHRWALLPIDDEVTRYAFPSKSSSYVMSGCGIVAVCGEQTSVSRWVRDHQVGITCEPVHDALVACFHSMEAREDKRYYAKDELLQRLDIEYFVDKLVEFSDFVKK